MSSTQGQILEFCLRHMNLFGMDTENPARHRQRIDRLASKSRPNKNVRVTPVSAGSVPAEWLTPNGATEGCALLYIHGGAWYMGSTGTHRAFVSRLAHACRVRALSINYRLAPEHPFPAGLQDCIEAYEWLLQTGIPASEIVVAGDSAGGNLTLALLVALRDAGKSLPAGAVTLSPATDLSGAGESYITRKRLDPIFANMGLNTIVSDYITDHDSREPLISPLYADLHGLPPMLIHVGDHEILLDDSVSFGERARAAGVQVQTVVWPGMFHVFHVFSPFLPEAREAIKEIAKFIQSLIRDAPI